MKGHIKGPGNEIDGFLIRFFPKSNGRKGFVFLGSKEDRRGNGLGIERRQVSQRVLQIAMSNENIGSRTDNEGPIRLPLYPSQQLWAVILAIAQQYDLSFGRQQRQQLLQDSNVTFGRGMPLFAFVDQPSQGQSTLTIDHTDHQMTLTFCALKAIRFSKNCITSDLPQRRYYHTTQPGQGRCYSRWDCQNYS